jgi:hypothetical protein
MPKQHSFVGQTNHPSNQPSKEKTSGPAPLTPRRNLSLPAEAVGEGIGWTFEILEAFTEFPWLIALLFPVFLVALWLRKRPAKP